MSARILSSLTEEKPNLHKQFGCMNGLFQLFHRSTLHCQNHKRLLSGTNNMEAKSATQIEIEKTPKAVQHEPFYCGRGNLLESPPHILLSKQSNSSHSGRHSPDIRDVVKDSMYREARGLSVKTVAKVEGRVHVMKHIDSPRPLQQSNYGKLPNGSARAPAKLSDATWNAEEDNVCCLQRAPKDSRRFSCDGRESTETKQSMMKLKDLPRLSLDSRQQSLRSSTSESRSDNLLGNRDLLCHNRSSSVIAKLMGLDAFPSSAPSNEVEIVTPNTSPAKDSILLLSIKSAGKSKMNQVTVSPRISEEDFASPQMKSMKSVTRPASSSRQPEMNRASQKSSVRYMDMEALTQSPHLSSVYGEIERRISEIEFRRHGKDLRALKQILEKMRRTTQKSEGKIDLQASDADLQQVQQRQQRSPRSLVTKVTWAPKGSESSNLTPRPAKLSDRTNFARSAAPTVNVSRRQEVYPQDSVNNRDDIVHKQTSKDMTPRADNVAGSGQHLSSFDQKSKGRTSMKVQTMSRQQQRGGSFTPALEKSYGTLSPRLQQNKQGMDKQSCQTTPSSETSKVRRQSIIESGSSKRNQKTKLTNMQQADDLNETVSYKRNLSKHGGAVPLLSEINNRLASQVEAEASINCSVQINLKRQEDKKERGDTVRHHEDTPTAELAAATVEQLSPVSVLDATFHVEESPSPVKKKIVTAFRDEFAGTVVCYRDELDNSPCRTRIELGTESNHKMLKSKEDLVRELRQLNSTIHEANMDQLASLCQNHNPDHRYVTKIVLASGLLNDVDSVTTAIQLSASNHLINPKLFHILEQTEESSVLVTEEHSEEIAQTKFDQKAKRKIIFDTVNEILVRKLGSDNNSMQRRKCWSVKQLLEELKSEIDHLNPKTEVNMDTEEDELISILKKDMMHQSEDWTNHQDEIPVLVLNIERLIFRDLIAEIISNEAIEKHRRPSLHCKQLQTK